MSFLYSVSRLYIYMHTHTHSCDSLILRMTAKYCWGTESANICVWACLDMFKVPLSWNEDQMSQLFLNSVAVHILLLAENNQKQLGQHINIKFCVMIGKSSHELLVLWHGEDAMNKSGVFWLIEGRSRNCAWSHKWTNKTQRTDANIYLKGLRQSVWKKRAKLWTDSTP